MATEIELKLRLTPKTAKRLAAHPLLANIPAKKLHLLNTYYDTPALDLHARRIALRFRKKGEDWLLTVKSAEPASGGLAVRSEWETSATPGVFEFSHVDFPALKNFLDNSTEELQAVFTTNFKRTLWQVPFGDSLIELAVDRGNINSKAEKTAICEVELELLSGNIADLFALTEKLQEDFDLRPAVESKAERGYALFTGESAQPFHAHASPLSAELSPLEAFQRIALGCLEHWQRNEAGLLNSEDTEYVHQARVALRRLRSAIKLFSPILPIDFAAAYSEAWKALANALGDARNWDVFLAETLPPIQAAFPKHRDTLRLKTKGLSHAQQSRQAIKHLIQQPEYPKLVAHFTATLYALRPSLPQTLTSFAKQRLAKAEKRVGERAKHHALLDPALRHQLRIHIKKLRYAVEFFSPLFPEESMNARLSNLTHLQNRLGDINDLVTAECLITEALGKQAPGPVDGWIAGRHELLCQKLTELLANWRH